MAEVTKVLIGIQARSTSERFPRKVFEEIEGKPMIQWVIDACKKASAYLVHNSHRTKFVIQIALLVPTGDELADRMERRAFIWEGPEDDVLTRYVSCAQHFDSDYIVRVTGDCPLLPPFMITKHITTAVMNQYDYCSNVSPEIRTAPDGYDCEVISRRLIDYLGKHAQMGPDREHVTLMARSNPPDWARIGSIIGHADLSNIKWSVDTQDDLDAVRAVAAAQSGKQRLAEETHGKENVHKV